MKIALWSARFSELKENGVDHTFWLHLLKNKQKMKTGWTTHSWNKAIWLALSLCHMTMTRKINKIEKPVGPQGNFLALFGRSAAFYGHFWVDTETSEWSTCISSSSPWQGSEVSYKWFFLFWNKRCNLKTSNLNKRRGCLLEKILTGFE